MANKNLKELAAELNNDILKNSEFITRETSFVIDGSFNSEDVYLTIIGKLDKSKERLGKHTFNLVAYVGINTIQRLCDVNRSQALQIWKYLDKKTQIDFDNIVIDLLHDFEL